MLQKAETMSVDVTFVYRKFTLHMGFKFIRIYVTVLNEISVIFFSPKLCYVGII